MSNPVVGFAKQIPIRILSGPLHRLMSDRYAVLEFTGRRTGTAYRVPIAYRQTGERLTLSTDSGWWVNLVGGREFTVRLRGTSRRATARRIRDAAAVDALRELTTIPGYAKAAEIPRQDGTVAEAALRRAAAERVVLEVAVS